MRVAVLALLACLLCAGCGASRHATSPPSIHRQSHIHRLGDQAVPVAGDILFVSNGRWSGSPTGFAYSWKDCDSNGANCSTAAGSPTNTNRYAIVSGDNGFTIRVAVTASYSGHPDSTVLSQPTALVGGSPPSLTAEPIASGAVATGETVSTTNGSWTNSPTGFSYQWQRCPTDGSSCSDISSATSSTYTVQSADAGDVLRAKVTASNAGGNSSPATSPMIPFGDNFSADSSIDPNVWNVLGIFDTGNADCFLPANTTLSGGVLTETAKVQATSCPDGTGTTTYTSGAVEANTFNYTYGTLIASVKMAGSSGAGTSPALWYTGGQCQSPSYQANECNWPTEGSREVDIAEIKNNGGVSGTVEEHIASSGGGFTSCTPSVSSQTGYHTYELDWTAAHIVWKIDGTTECTETTDLPSTPMYPIVSTAVGGGGGGGTITGLPQATTVQWIYVTTDSPTNTAVPTISGSTVHGNALSVTNGSWTNSPTSFTYQWQRCVSPFNQDDVCTNIVGSTSSSYTTVAGDAGKKIQAVVTAHTANGASAATTVMTAAIS